MTRQEFDCINCPTKPEEARALFKDEATGSLLFCKASCKRGYDQRVEAARQGQGDLFHERR